MSEVVKISDAFQKLSREGVESAIRSYGEFSRGFQTLAARLAENSKKALEDATRTWEQLISAKSLEHAIEIQTQYTQRNYDNFVAEASKIGEWYVDFVRNATKPLEKAVNIKSVEQAIANKGA